LVGFDDLYREGGALTWQAGKEDVVRQVVDLLMGLDSSSRVLDFGCGTGWTAELLTTDGSRYLGIDPSGEGVAVARRRHPEAPNIRFHRPLHDTLEPEGLLTTISHIYRESRVADSLLDDVTRNYGYPHFLSGVQRKALLERHGYQDIRRYRFYHRHPFNPSDFLGHPPEAIALARQLYEREGALVVTARR
jgi:SAM-dependent methyltransferase